MATLLKIIVLVAGCTAIYGLATGQDLNELFANLMNQAVPVINECIKAAYNLFKEAIGH